MNGVRFNADEILEIARQIERNGAKWYRTVARRAPEGRVREVLLDLAAMEEDHEQTFARMRAQLASGEREPVVFDPAGEGTLYLQAMADGYVFDVRKDPSDSLTGRETTAEILKAAIGLEADSILFYVGIKELVPAELGPEWIDEIIRQEMGHIVTLSRQFAELAR